MLGRTKTAKLFTPWLRMTIFSKALLLQVMTLLGETAKVFSQSTL